MSRTSQPGTFINGKCADSNRRYRQAVDLGDAEQVWSRRRVWVGIVFIEVVRFTAAWSRRVACFPTEVASEEDAIRTNPAARTTDLLKKVFG